jgi:hypothetical protein
MFKSQRSIINVYMQIPCLNGERKDIINFYNDVYIKSMKAYIIALKDSPASIVGSRTP